MAAAPRVAGVIDRPIVTRVGRGVFLVTTGDAREIVYVAGPAGDRWAFWKGQLFHSTGVLERTGASQTIRAPLSQVLTAPMPATVIKVHAAPGAHVTKGTELVVLEAMKMELPVRAPSDGVVTAVRCREGELVQADQPLVEME